MIQAIDRASSADGVAWDLSDLYRGVDDPRITATWTSALERAPGLRDGLPRQDRQCPAAGARNCCSRPSRELEGLFEQMDRPAVYASLLHAAKTDDPRHGALLARTREAADRHQQAPDLLRPGMGQGARRRRPRR